MSVNDCTIETVKTPVFLLCDKRLICLISIMWFSITLNCDIKVMIYVKQPTTSTYRTGGSCRTTVFGSEGGGWRRPSGSKRQVLPPVLLFGEQRHHLKFYLLSRTVRMEATGKCQQQDGLTRSTRRHTVAHRCCICARLRPAATAACRRSNAYHRKEKQ